MWQIRPRTGAILAVLLLLLSAAALRSVAVERWLPYYFEDATPALRALAYRSSAGQYDFNPRFFHYPAATFYLHFAAQGLGVAGLRVQGSDADQAWRQLHDPALWLLIARWTTVACDLALVLLLLRAGGPGGVLAAGLAAVNCVQVQYAQTVIVDVPLTLCVFLCLQALAHQRVRAAACWAGLAAAAKYPAALLLLFVFAERPRTLAWALGGGVFLLLNPYILLDWQRFSHHWAYEVDHMLEGHFVAHEVAGAYYYGVELWRALGSLPLLCLAALGVIMCGGEPGARRAVRVHALWVGTYLAMIMMWSTHAVRYLLPVLPSCYVLASHGAQCLWSGHRYLGRAAVVAVVLAYLIWQGHGLARYFDTVRSPHTQVELQQWFVAQGRPLMAAEHYTLPDARDNHYLTIPMDVRAPARTTGFYDLRWYGLFDYVVISSYVYERYLAQPSRFSQQALFYYTLEDRWPLAERFLSTGKAGPTLLVYKNPEPARALRRNYTLTLTSSQALVGSSLMLSRAYLQTMADLLTEYGQPEAAKMMRDVKLR